MKAGMTVYEKGQLLTGGGTWCLIAGSSENQIQGNRRRGEPALSRRGSEKSHSGKGVIWCQQAQEDPAKR